MLAPKRFCLEPFCSERVTSGRCEKHKRAHGKMLRDTGAKDKRYSGSKWQRVRREVMEEHDGWCLHCREQGRQTIATVVDHVIPSWAANVDFYDKSNLRPACYRCNREKAQTDAVKYRRGNPAPPAPYVIG